MELEDIRITYVASGVLREFDEMMERTLKPLGFKRWASGYEFGKSKRDLAFSRIPSLVNKDA